MPMLYAREADVLHDLQIDPETDEAAVARVTVIENGLAGMFDAKTGRSFAKEAFPVARTYTGPHSPVLVINDGIVSVTSVRVGGRWDGTAFIESELLPMTDWRLVFTDEKGVSYGLERVGYEWGSPVHITGVWASQGNDPVPADVRHALTLLTVKEYRRTTSTANEQVGPDGLIVSTPSGWNDPTVKAAVEAHTLVRVVV